jgi:hypothetical protein
MLRGIYRSERTPPKCRSTRFSIIVPCDSSASRSRAEFGCRTIKFIYRRPCLRGSKAQSDTSVCLPAMERLK